MDGVRYVGNAVVDSADHRGWLLGHFLDADRLRGTSALEVKWGIHPAGEARPRWATSQVATTLALLIHGRFVVAFPDDEIVLEREGDYVLWGAGIPHRWRAETDSVVLTLRWPSLPNDSIDLAVPEPTPAI